MAFRDNRIAINQARGIAEAHDCFILECNTPNGLVFCLYRRRPNNGRGVFLGRRSNPSEFFRLVDRVCSMAGRVK
jgi:hypothetical protein